MANTFDSEKTFKLFGVDILFPEPYLVNPYSPYFAMNSPNVPNKTQKYIKREKNRKNNEYREQNMIIQCHSFAGFKKTA